MVLAITPTTLTAITAISAAFAALAALATVGMDFWRQRLDRRPNVSAGFLSSRSTGKETIEFVNAGPGLAIHLFYYLHVGPPGEMGAGSLVGNGHLQANERASVDVPIPVPGTTVEFVWCCRDIDQHAHIWSYSGEHERLKKGDYPTSTEAYCRLYPETLPRPDAGASEDLNAPEETLPSPDAGASEDLTAPEE